MALTNTKTQLKGAVTGHSLLAKKRDALMTRFRAILKKVDEVSSSIRLQGSYELVSCDEGEPVRVERERGKEEGEAIQAALPRTEPFMSYCQRVLAHGWKMFITTASPVPFAHMMLMLTSRFPLCFARRSSSFAFSLSSQSSLLATSTRPSDVWDESSSSLPSPSQKSLTLPATSRTRSAALSQSFLYSKAVSTDLSTPLF
jgi:hypothetical protein